MVGEVKNQLGCGSSYIFAAVGALESRLMIRSNQTLESLSAQYFLDCLPDNLSRANKCSGGTEVEVFSYAA